MLKLFRQLYFEYKISILYLIFGLLWIFFSDIFFDTIIYDKHILTQFQTIKGFFYVIITTLMLFLLIKNHMEKLREFSEKAKESDRLKTAFLNNISHELRTPMNGILGFSRLLADPNLTQEEQEDYINIMEKSGNRMLNLITDLVDVSKVQSNTITCFYSDFLVKELLLDVFNSFALECAESELKFLLTNMDKIDSISIHSDYDKIQSVLHRLIKNSIKYTKKGKIEFGCHKIDENLEFFVTDTGIGIPVSRQEAIFESFVQADLEDKDASQGTGLGLTISRAFIEKLKGRIWVDSTSDSGTTIKFIIPIH